MSSSVNRPLVVKSSSYGNETTVGNSHNVRVIFISAVVLSICASKVHCIIVNNYVIFPKLQGLLFIAAMCLIVFALVRKKRKGYILKVDCND